MAKLQLRNSTLLQDYGEPYVVAEINTSHFGNIDTAKQMIDEAKNAGCDCVKFQSWTAESLYSRTYYEQNPMAERFVRKFSLSQDELAEVAAYSKDKGIDFASTPYSQDEVTFLLESCDTPYIKVASMDVVNHPFLDFIARTQTPIVLSTGMADLAEIDKAVRTIELAGNQNICLLHCVSVYPPQTSTIHLNNILGLRDAFPDYPTGFSDHSLGIEMASAAIALGACLIEKHFTLDRSKIGMDNQMAVHPSEMSQLVRNCHNVRNAMGERKRHVLADELEQREKMRRSVIAVRDLKAGTTLTLGDLGAKRPGIGYPPEGIEELVGKTLTRDVAADTLITPRDIGE